MSSHLPEALLFDCDGVILDSAKLKLQIFREMLTELAPAKIDEIMHYYSTHGGTSRVRKFEYLLPNILGEPADPTRVDELATEFSQRVVERVVSCPFIAGAEEFLTRYHRDYACYVISGTPQPELRDIFHRRGIESWFAGIYGSPRTKAQVGQEIIAAHSYDRRRVVFLGDATTDRDAAAELGVHFIGLSGPHLDPFVGPDDLMVDDLSSLQQVLEGLSSRG